MTSVEVPGQVVELRVHGVSGTPPEHMLNDPHPVQVGGDDSGRVFRRNEPLRPQLAGGHARTVEAFHWGRFTAGSPTRALWLLLAPFAILNVARYALLVPSGSRRLIDKLADLVLRLLGLTMTLSLVVTAAYVGLDIGARQCVVAGCGERNGWLGFYVERSFQVRVLVATILPAAVLGLVWWFGRQSFQYDPPGAKRDRHAGNDSLADLMFWRGAPSAPLQRAAHAIAGCAVHGATSLGILDDPGIRLVKAGGWPVLVRWVLYAGCLGAGIVALVLVVANHEPKDLEPDDAGHDSVALPPWVRRLRRWFAVPLAAACVLFTVAEMGGAEPAKETSLPGLEVAANLTSILTGVFLVVLFLVCWRLAATGRELRQVPAAFRPYWAGLGAWVVTTFAAMLASGFSTSVVFWTAKALGRPVLAGVPYEAGTIQLAASYWTGALLWGAVAAAAALALVPLAAWLLRRNLALVALLDVAAFALAVVTVATYDGKDLASDRGGSLLVAAALLGAAVAVCARPGPDGFADVVKHDYPGQPDSVLKWARKPVLRQWRATIGRFRYQHALGLVASLGGVLVIAAAGFATWRVAVPRARVQPPALVDHAATGVFGTVGVAVVSAIAAGLVALGVAAWRQQAIRTATGILWDLVSFWPRIAHPLCPPPYGGRAVLGVAQRASQLAGDLKAKTVVLSGHSQGAVISVAACAVLYAQATADGPEPENEDAGLDRDAAQRALARLRLLTYGSQLQFIFARLFPSYLGFGRLHHLYAEVLGGRWRHLYRWTDPLGTHVLSWPAGDAQPGPLVTSWTLMSCEDPANCPGHPADNVPVALVDQAATAAQVVRVGHHYWAVGPDARLTDPDTIIENAYRPRSPLRGHSGHEADPSFDAVLAELVAGHSRVPACPEAEPPAGAAGGQGPDGSGDDQMSPLPMS